MHWRHLKYWDTVGKKSKQECQKKKKRNKTSILAAVKDGCDSNRMRIVTGMSEDTTKNNKESQYTCVRLYCSCHRVELQ